MFHPIDVRILSNLSPPDWWTIGLTGAATILGAVIGAVIAYLVARQSATDARALVKASTQQMEETATLRALVKVMELCNAVAGYKNQIEGTIAKGIKLIGREVEPWMVMLPIIGKPMEVYITSDDLIAFVRARKFDYITEVLYVVSRYNGMIYGVEEYSRRREELMSYMTPDAFNGMIGTMIAGNPKLRELMPLIVTVNDLAKQLRQEVEELSVSSIKVSDQFGPIVREYFQDKGFPIPGPVPSANGETKA